MHVISHQYVGMYSAAVTLRGLAEFLSIVKIVGIISKAGPTVVAALDYVLRYAGKVEAG